MRFKDLQSRIASWEKPFPLLFQIDVDVPVMLRKLNDAGIDVRDKDVYV